MPHSVILLTDVPGLGQVGDQKRVKDGFARNYLIPNRLAVYSTPNMVKRFERQKEKINAEREKLLKKAQEMAERIGKVGLNYERPVGQAGRLFGAITPMDIAAELGQQGVSVEKKSIIMSGPIKTPGDHTIRVRIHSQVVVDVPVKVVGIEINKSQSDIHEEEEAAAPEPEKKEKEEEAAKPQEQE